MAKLTKQQSRNRRAAEKLLEKDTLSPDDRIFVYENWHEGVSHDNGRAGAFFTPLADGLHCVECQRLRAAWSVNDGCRQRRCDLRDQHDWLPKLDSL
jgi:hypothetical protein